MPGLDQFCKECGCHLYACRAWHPTAIDEAAEIKPEAWEHCVQQLNKEKKYSGAMTGLPVELRPDVLFIEVRSKYITP